MSALPLLIAAGSGGGFIELVNQVGWFMPFLALIVPVSLILLLALGKVSTLLLCIAQMAGIYFSLRPMTHYLRRARFGSLQIKLAMGPFYLIVCFITNLLALLCFHVFRRYF